MTDHDIGPDDGFERWLADASPTLNAPPATPREEMWTNVSARLTGLGARPRAKGRHIRPWLWPLAIAAALVLGAAIDRFALRRGAELDAPRTLANRDSATTDEARAGGRSAIDPSRPKPRPGLERSPAVADRFRAPTSDGREPSSTLRLAASQTLSQAELLLAAYRADDSTDTRQLGRWARDVLGSTRLLLDTRVAQDAQLRALLEDLELVLMQIAQLSGSSLDKTDRELLDRTLRERDLLPRIRSAVPPGTANITTGTSD